MGVSGLTQYLQKTCPHIIQKLPERLKEISGKRIVIDGTLITQRLHYGFSPYPSRHVLGWYHLAQEMNESGVPAICIFDGPRRSKAKAEETRRRQESQRLQVSRGYVEVLRTKRLQTIKSLVSDVHSLDEEGKSKIAEMLSRLNNSPDAGNVGAVEEFDHVEERLDALDDRPNSAEFANEKLSSDKLLDGEILPLASFPSEMISPVESKVQAESTPTELFPKESPLPAVSLTQEIIHSPQISSQDMPLPTESPPAEPAPEVVLTSPPTLNDVIPTEPMINEILHPVEPPIQEAVDSLQTTSAEVLTPSAQLPPKELLLPAEPQIQEALYSPQTPSEVVPPAEPMINEKLESLTKEMLPPAEPVINEMVLPVEHLEKGMVSAAELAATEMLPPAKLLTKEMLSPAELPTQEMLPSAEPVINEVLPLLEKELLSAAEVPTKEMFSTAEPPTREMVPPAEPVINEMVPPVEHLEKRMLSATEHLEKEMLSSTELSTKEMLPSAEPLMKEMLSLMKEMLPLMKEMLPLMRKMLPHVEPPTKEMLPIAERPTDETLAATGSPVKEMPSSAEPLTKEMITPLEPPMKEVLSIAEFPTDETLAVVESPVKETPSPIKPLTKEMSTPTEPPMKEMLPIAEPPTDETFAAAESPNAETTIITSPSLPPPSQQVAIINEHAPTLVPPALQLPQDSSFVGSAKSESVVPIPSISSVEEMMATLLSSYQDFRSSITKVVSFPVSRGKVSSLVDEFSTQEDDDLVLSKTQCELTLEEGRVWDELTLATTPPISPTVIEDDAAIPDILTPSDTTPVPTDISTIAPSPTTMPSEPSPMPTPPATAPSLLVETSTIPSLSTTMTTVKTPFLPASEPYEFGIDQPLFQAAEDRLDALRIRSELITESYQRRTDAPTKSTYMESRQILEAMGILCYEVEGEDEGEALASSLVLQGLADYVVSEDSDVLVYGAPMVRNISSRSTPLVLIDGNVIPEVLGLSEDAYIDFALLLGTDFTRRIKNVGPHRAHKLLQTYGSIEGIIDGQSKYQPGSRTDYLAEVDTARALFSSLVPVPDRLATSMMPNEFRFGVVDQAKVNVIMERCGLGKVLMGGDHWEFEAALTGNYFDDNPGTYL